MFVLAQALSPKDLKETINLFLDSKKAQDIISIDLKGKSSIADYMVIASGTSQRQIGMMAQVLREELKKLGLKNIHIEGFPQCDWVLVDTGDIIVHLFRPEVRSFYNLEKIWTNDANEDHQKTSPQ